MFCSAAPVPAASSTNAATVDLRSTDPGVAAERPRDSATAAGQPAPSATPVISGAGATPATAPSGSSGAATDRVSSPGAKLVVPEAPYLGRHDLAAEDKIRFFDRIAELVWFLLLYS